MGRKETIYDDSHNQHGSKKARDDGRKARGKRSATVDAAQAMLQLKYPRVRESSPAKPTCAEAAEDVEESNKYVTEHCGFLNKLTPGDVVLADRGFDIAESVGTHGAELHIPSFTKGKNQLPGHDVETTRRIANVRIHVERVIGSVRQKYTILQGILPVDYLLQRGNNRQTLVDKTALVCCALTNQCESVVPFD